MTTSAPAPPEAPVPLARMPGSWFRADVDGLRAVAILFVVGYHASWPFFGGGFIGVDVFFVISGFLISRNLLREAEQRERVGLLGFWARRMRRLVPALALVLLVTLVAGMFVLPRYQQADAATQGAAAALYVSNFLFAVQAGTYFAADVATSPFLHTWSLGVEEQFYVLWPLLVALACARPLDAWARRRRRGRRSILLWVFVVVFATSFAWGLVLTRAGTDWAFFGLPSRAWEFAAGGLLAAVTIPGVLRRVAVRTGLAVAGLAVLAAGMALIDDTVPYPGSWALLPVAGTILVLLAGETWGGEARPTPVSALLSTAPAQWLGRVSYSWYLWHWPAIVLVVAQLDVDTVRVRTAAALATLPVAWLAYRFVETPIRFAPSITRSNVRTYAFAAATTAAVVATALVIQPRVTAVEPDGPWVASDFEAPPDAPIDERVEVALAAYVARNENHCPEGQVKTPEGDAYCPLGDPDGTKTVLVLGDSHTGQWRRPLDQVARTEGIRLLTRQHSGCPPYPVPITSPSETDLTICADDAAADQRLIDSLDPDAVLVAAWSGNIDNIHESPSGGKPEPAVQARLWEDGVRSFVTGLQDRGITAGIILDEPTLPSDPKRCFSSNQAIEPCELDRERAAAISGPLLAAERRVVADHGVVALDMTEVVCDSDVCNLEIDGTLVYVDRHHLTDAFTAKRLPELTTLLRDLTR